METGKRTSLMVSPQTQMQLKELRGTYSTDEFLSGVIYYLKLYRIDPMRRDISPNQDVHNHYNDVMKRIEDVIKIIKSSEKGMKELIVRGLKTETGMSDSAVREENAQLKELVSKLRLDLRDKDDERTKKKLMDARSLFVEFVEGGMQTDGSIFIGPARSSQLKAAIKAILYD